MSWETVVALCSTAAIIVVAVVQGRTALATQRLQVAVNTAAVQGQSETDAGKLALAIALATRAEHQETRGRLNAHEEWREELVNTWLPEHKARDLALEREVQKLDPSFVPPPWQPLPRLKRYVPPAADAAPPV